MRVLCSKLVQCVVAPVGVDTEVAPIVPSASASIPSITALYGIYVAGMRNIMIYRVMVVSY